MITTLVCSLSQPLPLFNVYDKHNFLSQINQYTFFNIFFNVHFLLFQPTIFSKIRVKILFSIEIYHLFCEGTTN